MSSRPRVLGTLFAAAVLALGLTACGGGSTKAGTAADREITATPSAQVTAAPAAGAKVIAVTVSTVSVTPDGGRITVGKGQPIVFRIQAAAAGELHVHSSPATAIHYPAGASEATITIDLPGIIEVEIENLGKPVAQLEVR